MPVTDHRLAPCIGLRCDGEGRSPTAVGRLLTATLDDLEALTSNDPAQTRMVLTATLDDLEALTSNDPAQTRMAA